MAIGKGGAVEEAEFLRPHILGAQHGAQRNQSAAEGFRQQDDVNRKAWFGVGRKHRSGAAQAGLDLIENEQGPVLVANVCGTGQIPWRRHAHAAFPLHGLDQEGCDIAFAQSFLEGFEVIERDAVETCGVEKEWGAVENVVRRRQGAECLAVEATNGADDDLALRSRSCQLDACLDYFGAAVHEGRVAHVAGRELRQGGGKLFCCGRHQRLHEGRLLLPADAIHAIPQFGRVMAERNGTVLREKVEVAIAVLVEVVVTVRSDDWLVEADVLEEKAALGIESAFVFIDEQTVFHRRSQRFEGLDAADSGLDACGSALQT